MPARTHMPRIEIPAHLSDESAVQILEFLYDVTRAFESRYVDQIHRYYDNLRTDMMSSADATASHAPAPRNPDTDPF